MAYTSEIEKLEARYRENPKGRNFAPLADAYRKAGLIDNAIELCQAGLTLHPDYVSGHIVHGRCLVDKKDDAGAEAVFRKVLELDPENILALKVLAEVAERNNHYDHAMEWLNRLLLADPMNGEAAEGLSRVRGKAATQPITPPAAAATAPVAALVVDAPPPAETSLQVEHEAVEFDPGSAPVDHGAAQRALGIENLEGPFDPSAPTAAMARPDFVLERTSEVSPESNVAAPEPEPEIETVDFNPAAAEPVETDGLLLDEEPAIEPDPGAQVEGLARTQYEGSGMFRVEGDVDPTPFEERPTSPVADLPLIMPEELDLPPVPAAPPPSTARVAAATPAPVPPPPPIGHHDDDDGAADQAALSQAEPVLTETMAELYLRQGHREDALRVYEALAAQRPHDTRLREKVAQLSAPPPPRSRPAAGGQSAGAFLRGILGARPGAPAPPAPEPPVAPRRSAPAVPPPAAEEPVDVAPDDTAPAGEAAPGSPTRPASDAISLDSVFGEESNRASAPAVSEHVPDPGTTPAPEGGFSFDDFFGSPGSPNAGNKASPNARPSRSSGRARAPEKEEDLDQFQAWLKSLKA